MCLNKPVVNQKHLEEHELSKRDSLPIGEKNARQSSSKNYDLDEVQAQTCGKNNAEIPNLYSQ